MYHGEQSSLNRVLDDMNMVTWSYEPVSKRVFVSRGIQRVAGCGPYDLQTRPGLWQRLVHPYDNLRMREAWRELAQGKRLVFEHRLLLPDGTVKWVRHYAMAVGENNKKFRFEGLIIDISEQKEQQERMQQMAFHDSLTGLANRNLFENYFKHCLASSQYFPQRMAIMFIDLDGFKSVNDRYGHDTGDLLLMEAARRFKTQLRGSDLLARMGGDEFVALLTRVSRESLVLVADRIIEAFSSDFTINGQHISTGVSVGISIYPDDGGDLETLVKNADQAMYMAKREGKNTYRFFDQTI